jgi:hypothetical protein
MANVQMDCAILGINRHYGEPEIDCVTVGTNIVRHTPTGWRGIQNQMSLHGLENKIT